MNEKQGERSFLININDYNPQPFCVIHVLLDEAGEPVDWTFEYCNDAMAKLEGVDKETLLSHSFFEIFPNADRKWLKPYYSAAYGGRVEEFDDISEKIGVYLHIKAFHAGEVGYCACVITNIRKQVLQRLREKERLDPLVRAEQHRLWQETVRTNQELQQMEDSYKRLHGLIRSGMWRIYYNEDGSQQRVEWSQEFRNMLGYCDESDFPNTLEAWAELLHPEDRREPVEAIGRVLQSEDWLENYDEEYRLLTKDQGYRWFQAKGTVTRRIDGTPSCFWGVFFDVTEKKLHAELEQQKNQALEMATDALASANESMRAMDMLHQALGSGGWYFYYDAAGRLNKVIWSDAFRALLGFSAQEDFPDTWEAWFDRLHPDDVAAMYAAYNATLEDTTGQHTYDVEFRVLTYDRGYRWFKATGRISRREDGSPDTFYGLFMDIDNEKRLDQKLHKALEKAERANMAKTDFLRHMSHDIRTPLNGISGLLELSEHYPEDVERLKENRRKMRVSAYYLLSLVNNVLDMSKLEDGCIDLEGQPFDLLESLQENMNVIQNLVDDMGLQFVGGTEKSNIVHRRVLGSRQNLSHILMNLAGNAIKFNRKNGTVRMYVQELSCEEGKAIYQIVCADTGIGMSKDFQKKMFEPFAQEGKATYTSYVGSGLGLPFVKNLVDRLGGNIRCCSQENVGTTFVITLPLQVDAGQPASEENVLSDISLQGRRVLLVDDNELNRDIARAMLESEGMLVDEAVDGREAVDKFVAAEPYHYDAILMDIMMPVMNGLESSHHIRALDRQDAVLVPIVALTANAFQDDVQRSLDAGMNAHCAKPFDINKIKKTLQQVLTT